VIALLDYGSGNAESVYNAIKRVSDRVERSSDAKSLQASSAVVIPGVGSFSAFMDSLGKLGVIEFLQSALSKGLPCLGICVGMQALVEWGHENGKSRGLAVMRGEVKHLHSLGVQNERVPHVGWNGLRLSDTLSTSHPLRTIEDRDVYFMHSYALAASTTPGIAWTDYGVEICSVIEEKCVLGVQFHPEESQSAGLDFLDAWIRSVQSP